jgi:hypothetical protein
MVGRVESSREWGCWVEGGCWIMVGTREAYWFAGWPVVVGIDGEDISKIHDPTLLDPGRKAGTEQVWDLLDDRIPTCSTNEQQQQQTPSRMFGSLSGSE